MKNHSDGFSLGRTCFHSVLKKIKIGFPAKKNIVKYRLSFFFPTSGQFPNPNQSADFKGVQYFPRAPFLPSRESNSSAPLAVLWDHSLLLSF